MAWAHSSPFDLKVLGFFLLLVAVVLCILLNKILRDHLLSFTITTSIIFTSYYKMSVVVVDRELHRFLEGRDVDLIKPIVIHEYGHRKLIGWPMSCIFTAILIIAALLLGYWQRTLALPAIVISLALIVYVVYILISGNEEYRADGYACKVLKDVDLIVRALEVSEEFRKLKNKKPSKFHPKVEDRKN